jgi:hypothetical protein
MLETIREYALERLADSGELEATGESHAMYSLALAEQGEPELFGHQQRLWVGRLMWDAENFRAALQWSQTHHRKEQLLHLAGNLGHFLYMSGRSGRPVLGSETLREAAPDVATARTHQGTPRGGLDCATWGKRPPLRSGTNAAIARNMSISWLFNSSWPWCTTLGRWGPN